ncbi:hypothetical protein [Helicobacter sp. 23-1046]
MAFFAPLFWFGKNLLVGMSASEASQSSFFRKSKNVNRDISLTLNMTKKILLTKKSVIASKNERKRIFAWESIFMFFVVDCHALRCNARNDKISYSRKGGGLKILSQ